MRFYINQAGPGGGPSIFGERLRDALIETGWKWNRLFPSISFIFGSGFFRPFGLNILRLDGLYLDSNNTLGDSDTKNKPLHKAYINADGIIFQSEFSRKLFQSFMGKRNCPQTVIPNGSPVSFSNEGPKIKYGFNKTLLCSGNWRAHKRLDCIIEGFLEYGARDTGLVIIGNAPEDRINHSNIKFIDRVPTYDLPQYLRGGDAFIHLSWLDNCPNSVVEVLSGGLPVLCTHNGGTKELVKDNGSVIECEEDYDFKKVNLYNPPKCDKKLVAAGIEKILAREKAIVCDYLRIENTASRYRDFALALLKK